jgi:hypothetical protein
MIATLAALVLPLVVRALPEGGGLELGRLAPDLELDAWIEPPPAEEGGETRKGTYRFFGGPSEHAGGLAADLRSRIPAYHGVPLVLHTFAWDDPVSTEKVLPLMSALVAANVDRGIAVVGVAHGGGEEELERELAELREHDVPYPVARASFAQRTGPYVDAAANGLAYAYVVGPNGALLWHGDPVEEEEDLLEAVRAAYARPVVEALEHPLHPALARAESAYLAADLRGAQVRAQKLAGAKEADVALGAAEIARLVDATAEAWMHEARAHASGPDVRYLELAAAIRGALERTDTEKALRVVEAEVGKEKPWRQRAEHLEAWLALRAERPAQFPARVDKAGDAFAQKLAELVSASTESSEAIQAAQELLQRYEQTRMREE